jgi:hypothetical protein
MAPWTTGPAYRIICSLPLHSFLLPSWGAVRSYRHHLEVRDPIWGDNWSQLSSTVSKVRFSGFFFSCKANVRRSVHIWGDHWSHSLHRRSSSWGFPGFSSAVSQMPGDLCTAPRIISLSFADKTWLTRHLGQVAFG